MAGESQNYVSSSEAEKIMRSSHISNSTTYKIKTTRETLHAAIRKTNDGRQKDGRSLDQKKDDHYAKVRYAFTAQITNVNINTSIEYFEQNAANFGKITGVKTSHNMIQITFKYQIPATNFQTIHNGTLVDGNMIWINIQKIQVPPVDYTMRNISKDLVLIHNTALFMKRMVDSSDDELDAETSRKGITREQIVARNLIKGFTKKNQRKRKLKEKLQKEAAQSSATHNTNQVQHTHQMSFRNIQPRPTYPESYTPEYILPYVEDPDPLIIEEIIQREEELKNSRLNQKICIFNKYT